VNTNPTRNRGGLAVLSLGATVLFLLGGGRGVLEAAPQFSSTAGKSAKQDYALIYGTVWGPDNHTVPGVSITIRRASDKKPKWELVSDRRGEFAQRVPAGKQEYIVQANIKTPKGQPKPEVTVHIDDDERRDVGIHLSQ